MSFQSAQGRLGLAAAFALAALMSAPAAYAEAAGLRVTKDPVTGQLRAPTPDEIKALEAQTAARTRFSAPRGLLTGKVNPQPIYHPDGTIEQELDESTQIYTVVTRAADGTMDTACVTGKDAAEAAVFSTKSVAKTAKASKEHNHEVK